MLTLADLIAGINLAKVQEADQFMERASLPVSGTVAAGATTPYTLEISPKGTFLCLAITGRFSTLTAAATDSGVCALKTSWSNGNGRIYIDDSQPLYLDCLLTPGRVRTAGVTGDPSGQLQFPGMPWIAFFAPKDVLTFKVQNEAAYQNTFQIALQGVWLKR